MTEVMQSDAGLVQFLRPLVEDVKQGDVLVGQSVGADFDRVASAIVDHPASRFFGPVFPPLGLEGAHRQHVVGVRCLYSQVRSESSQDVCGLGVRCRVAVEGPPLGGVGRLSVVVPTENGREEGDGWFVHHTDLDSSVVGRGDSMSHPRRDPLDADVSLSVHDSSEVRDVCCGSHETIIMCGHVRMKEMWGE